ncbi:ralA-binding protein 1-like [Saccostrea echinata]|uniref:ralA-binding protein 1-like n=1 Tax=Saccostrea echinata TaxID=191078 RepID=UPI002A83321D|nr:ralA-binding protein 1-like [Saccostrea echinata]
MNTDHIDGSEDGKKRDLLGKKRDSKKGQKDQGYMKFDEEDSDTSQITTEEFKSPSKAKKSKSFFKKQKPKEEKKDKEGKKDEKEKEKEGKREEKEGKKHKIKGKKKSKHEPPPPSEPVEVTKPIFGVPLSVAVERSPSHDGIELPRLFRECVDYIEEHGLSCEGIYRISGVKSKIQMLKDCYNRGAPVYLEEHEPNIIASLLKQFLRELPEPVLTKALMSKFEDASVVRGEIARCEAFRRLINDLPTCNRLLLSWMIVHMTHVIQREKENKMSLQNVSIVLSPTMQISHRVLNVLFQSSSKLFSDIEIKKYKPPIKPTTSRWSLELPESLAPMQEELQKQESLLNALHAEINAGSTDQEKEEQLWEVQRIVTQLKRKIKQAQKQATERKLKDESIPPTVTEEEELKLDLQVPVKQQAPPPPQQGQPTDQEATPISETAHQDESDMQHVPSQEQANQKEAYRETEEAGQTSANQEQEEEISDKATIDQIEETCPTSKSEQEPTTERKETLGDDVDSRSVEPEETQDTVTEMKQEVNQKEESIEQTQKGSEDQTESVEKEVTGQEVEVDKSKEGELAPQQEVEDIEKTEDVGFDQSAGVDTAGVSVNEQDESSDDQFENTAEKILEAERGVAHNWTDESEACVTDQEEGRSQVKGQQRSTEGQEEETVQEERQTLDEVDGEKPNDTSLQEEIEEDEEFAYDDEMMKLLEEEQALILEEEELLAIERELRKKIETERHEAERLNQEIDELKYLRQDSDVDEYSSESDSSYESEDEEDLQEILKQLIARNEEQERKNAELCSKIHEERMICLDVKVQIRMLQQKQLESSLSIQAILG